MTTGSATSSPAALTQLARACASTLQTDYIVPLDADEFIIARDRETYTEAIERASQDCVPLKLWRTYVPTPEDDENIQDPVRRITHRRRFERADLGKVVVPARLIRDESVTFREGNHGLMSPGNNILHTIVDDIHLGHFPIRSPGQFVSKALTNQLSMHLNPERIAGGAFHWKTMYEQVVDQWDITPEKLCEIGCSYSDRNPSDLVRDPLQAPAGVELALSGHG